MTTPDRIDHAAEAIGLRQRASDMRYASAANTLLAAAQVHATLALVEQQRIANLIALANVAGDPNLAVSPSEQQAWDALGISGSGVLRPDIAAALGVTDE